MRNTPKIPKNKGILLFFLGALIFVGVDFIGTGIGFATGTGAAFGFFSSLTTYCNSDSSFSSDSF